MAHALTLHIRRWRLAGLGLLLSCFFPAFAMAGDWFDRVWQTDEGLPDNLIRALAQTPDGYLWVSTMRGLSRFDGSRFQDFSPPNIGDAPNHAVRALLVDHAGRLWLGQDQGVVVCVMPGKDRIFTPKDGLPAARVRTMIEDGEGALWITYPGSRGVARIKDGVVACFVAGDELPNSDTCQLAADAAGQVWFTEGNKVGIFREGRFQTLLRLDERATSLAAARTGGIWITTATRLLKYKDGGKVEEHGNLPRPGMGQGIMLEDRTGAVWIGNTFDNGLFRYDGSGFQLVPTSYPQITCLLEDREDNLWVGTQGGLNRLRPLALDLLHVGKDSPPPSVRSACEDAAGSLWMVTDEGLLWHRQGTEQMNVTARTDWPGGQATCVTADHVGGVWIGTRRNGLYHLQDNHFEEWSKTNGLTNEAVHSLLVGSNGDLWIGTDTPYELLRLRGDKFLSFELPPRSQAIRAMAEDAAGNVWVGTAGGCLLRVSGDHVIYETTNYTQPTNSIRCLHAMADGSLWIGYGSGGGLARLKDGKYARIAGPDLEDGSVSQIIEDGQGWIWLAGSHDFFRVPTQQLIAVAEGRASHMQPIVFGPGERLPGVQANFDNYPAAFQGRDGRPRFATRTGLLVVHTENILDNSNPPPVVLERVAADGQTVALYDSLSPPRVHPAGVVDLRDPSATLRLPPNRRKIEFEFTALSLTAPENVQFRYRLEGIDKDWVEGGTAHFANYSWLPAGDYRFEVIACNNAGIWNETGATLGFTVLPLFWQTWWFRTAAIAGFTLSLIAIVRYVSFRRLRLHMQQIEQQAALARERVRIARDIHDDLGNRLTKISLLSELALRHRIPTDRENGHLEQISSTAREATDALDEIVWAINPRNDTLPHFINYIGQFAVEFLRTADIRCRVDLPQHPPSQPVPAEMRHNLFLVVKEALNNIIHHAGATEVWLRIAVSGQCLNLTIEDNGGVAPKTPRNGGGNGLANMNQRMSEIGGCFLIESRPGGGTRVSLEIFSLHGK